MRERPFAIRRVGRQWRSRGCPLLSVLITLFGLRHALVGLKGRDGLERREDVGARGQESLSEFLIHRLLEQLVADGTIRQINQATAEDGVQGIVVLVAVLLQEWNDLVPHNPEEAGGVLNGLARLQ